MPLTENAPTAASSPTAVAIAASLDGQCVTRKGLLEIHVAERGGHHTIAAIGDLDRSTSNLLERAVLDAEATNASQIVVDLSGLSFMDTSGLRLVLKAAERSLAASNRLTLIRGTGQVARLFEKTFTEPLLPFARLTH